MKYIIRFLKPEKRKILIFVSFIPLLYLCSYLSGYLPNTFDECWRYILLLPTAPLFLRIYLSPLKDIPLAYPVLPLLLLVFYWYLLSCLIIWLYNKVKGKL
jgi:hypothetical protein